MKASELITILVNNIISYGDGVIYAQNTKYSSDEVKRVTVDEFHTRERQRVLIFNLDTKEQK